MYTMGTKGAISMQCLISSPKPLVCVAFGGAAQHSAIDMLTIRNDAINRPAKAEMQLGLFGVPRGELYKAVSQSDVLRLISGEAPTSLTIRCFASHQW
jgi:hypothetical protein